MDSLAYKLWDWVCRRISYRSDDGEFWFFPGESLARGAGDCDDSANLLTSLLRSTGFNAYTVVGSYRGFGHAWTELDGQILETTYTYAHDVPDPQNYRAYAKFNDQETIELWPRSMSQLFEVARNECRKLTLMAEAQYDR
jgi:transglutaminase-like putative cysteine protease